MFLIKGVFFLSCLYLSQCGSFSVNNLPKCSLKDAECHRNLHQNIIKILGKSGVAELGLLPIDPIILKDVSVSVLNLVNLTMVDGVAKGIRSCVSDKFEIDIEKEKATQALTCDLLIKGHYSLSANSPLMKDLLGDGGLKGDGNGKVKLEKLRITFNFPFYPEKHDDGEIYMKGGFKNIVYKYDLKGKAEFGADKIYLGKENVSEFVIGYLNENYKFLMRTFGKAFIDKAMDYYIDFAQKFYNGVPAKNYILDDLSPYVKS